MSGQTIAGRYRLLEPLARGPMSSVWLADDEELGRQVAVKTLAPTADRDRFEREARAVASLAHPSICQLYDYGEAAGRPYMVLEYLPGGTLEDRLRGGRPLPDADGARIAAALAAGLAHAHAGGLVHRDLKPANILFDGEGRPKIADFGIARMGAGGLTETGTVLGTAAYISPEQAAGERAGPPSDVYSFGVILFRMLTGRLPFVAANAMELVRMHRDEPPPTVASIRPDAPPVLAGVADSALAKAPDARPRDGAALLAMLAGHAAAATAVLPAVPADSALTMVGPAVQPGAPQRARRGIPAAAGLAIVLLLGAAGAAAAWLATRPDSGATRPPPTVSLPAVPAGSPGAPPAATPATSASEPTTEPSRAATVVTSASTTSASTSATAPATTAAAAVPPATTIPATTTPITTAPTAAPTTAPAPPPTTAASPATTAPVTTAPQTTTAASTTPAEPTTAP